MSFERVQKDGRDALRRVPNFFHREVGRGAARPDHAGISKRTLCNLSADLRIDAVEHGQ
jgi:hypothetical protein